MNIPTILEITFTPTKKQGLIRATVHFDGFTLAGFKVIVDEKGPYVTPPSYPYGSGWRPLFRTDSPQDWEEIKQQILREYETYEKQEYGNRY